MQVLWSGIQACPKKYAFICQHHVLLGLICNIIKHTIFQGQVATKVYVVPLVEDNTIQQQKWSYTQKEIMVSDVYE